MSPVEITFLGAVAVAVVALSWSWVRSRKSVQQSASTLLSFSFDDGRSAEAISNDSLASVQRSSARGGMLEPGDLVIVWAQHFLDYDVLYEPVLENISSGVRYLYVLDQRFYKKFRLLYEKLREDVPERATIAKGIDVVFVKPSLTLNNFVLMSPHRKRQRFYSALIHDRRPFAWIRQNRVRAEVFLRTVERLVKLSAVQAVMEGDGGFGVPFAEDLLVISPVQMSLFSDLGRKILAAQPTSLDDYSIDLEDEIGDVLLPEPDDKTWEELGEVVEFPGPGSLRRQG